MEKMLVVAAHIIFMLNIDPALFINMGETPLMWVPSSKCTCRGNKGATTISTLCVKDNWLSFEGDIPIFHSSIKGKLGSLSQTLLFVRRTSLSHQPSKFLDFWKTNGLQ